MVDGVGMLKQPQADEIELLAATERDDKAGGIVGLAVVADEVVRTCRFWKSTVVTFVFTVLV